MEQAQLFTLLENTLSGDNSTRQNAEAQLTAMIATPGFLPSLLQAAITAESPSVRLSAAVAVKNAVKKWEGVAPEDRAVMKQSVYGAYVAAQEEKLVALMLETIKYIAREEFPQNWPEIITQLTTDLSANEMTAVCKAAKALHAILRKYKFLQTDERATLRDSIAHFFPRLEQLLAGIQQTGLTPESAELELWVLKCYWVTIYISSEHDVYDEAMFARWMTYVVAVTARETDVASWQTQRLAIAVLGRILQRATEEEPEPYLAALSTYFLTNVAPVALQNILALLNKSTQVALPTQLTVAVIKFLTQSLHAKKLKRTLEPILQTIVLNFILQAFQKTQADTELWDTDPVDYIVQSMGSTTSLVSAASDFIETLVGDIAQLTFLVEYINRELRACTDAVRKEALLYALGCLKEQIDDNQLYQYTVDSILSTQVRQELVSPIPIMRARAIWCYGRFAGYGLEDPVHRADVLDKTWTALAGADLPLKFEAAIALPKLLEWEDADALILPHLEPCLQHYVTLMGQIDNEELADALQEVVENFSESIVPYALQLIRFLVETFSRLVEGSEMIAVSVLTTLNKVIDSCKASCAHEIAPLIAPMVHYCLSEAGSAYMEEGINALEIIMEDGAADPAFVEQFYPYLYRSQAGAEPYGNENYTKLLPVFCLYFYKYSDVILTRADDTGVNFLEQTFAMIQHYFFGDDDSDARVSGKLLMAMIECYKGRIDNYVAQVPTFAQTKFASTKSVSVQSVCVQLLGMAIWYDTKFADQTSLAIIHQSAHILKECVDRKRVILGLLALCQANNEFYRTPWIAQFIAEQVKYILDNDNSGSTDNEDSDQEDESDEESDEEDAGEDEKADKVSVESDILDSEENFDSPLNQIDPVRFSKDVMYTQVTYQYLPEEVKPILEAAWATLE